MKTDSSSRLASQPQSRSKPGKLLFQSGQAQTRFFANVPPEITRWEWLWHRANRHRFEPWVETLLVTISNLSSRFGWTFCHQKFLAREFGKSERWLGEILGRLTAIGVVETDRRADGNHYRLNPGFEALKNFAQKPGSVGSSAGSSGQKSPKPTATLLKQKSSTASMNSDMVSMTCYDNTEPPHTRAQAQARAHEEEPKPAIEGVANPEWGQRMELAEQILAACNQLFELKLRTVAIHQPKPFVTTLAHKPLAELQQDLDGHLNRIAEHQRKRAAQPGPGGTASVPLTEAEIKWQNLPEPEQAHWHDLAFAEMEHNGTYDQIRKEFGPQTATGNVYARARELYAASLLPEPASHEAEPASDPEAELLDRIRTRMQATGQYAELVAEGGDVYAENMVKLAAYAPEPAPGKDVKPSESRTEPATALAPKNPPGTVSGPVSGPPAGKHQPPAKQQSCQQVRNSAPRPQLTTATKPDAQAGLPPAVAALQSQLQWQRERTQAMWQREADELHRPGRNRACTEGRFDSG